MPLWNEPSEVPYLSKDLGGRDEPDAAQLRQSGARLDHLRSDVLLDGRDLVVDPTNLCDAVSDEVGADGTVVAHVTMAI